MERKWRELWFDRSAWSWTRLVTGLFCAALALSLILAGLNSLLGAPTGLTLSGLGTGISTGNPDADPNKQGNQGKTGSQGPQSLGQGIIPGGDLATALSEQIQFHGGPEGPALPVMQINGQTGTAYLRVGVPQSYPNTETRAPNQPYEGEELRHQVNAASKSTKTITVDPVSRSTQLSTPLYTTHVSSSTNGLTYSPEMQTFRSESGQSEPYQVSFDLYRYGETLLSSARTARRPVYTQLSSGITARTQALAQQITAGADTPYELARRLEQYLETNYSYDFEFQGPPPG
ncbi:MAG: hypothetical protein ACM3ZQ_01835, partial [Bacillota bacterium]